MPKKRKIEIEIPTDLELSEAELAEIAEEVSSLVIEDTMVRAEVKAKPKEKTQVQPVIVQTKQVPKAKVKQQTA